VELLFLLPCGHWAILEKRVPYSQRYLLNAIADTNHNANPTNPNRNSKGNPNPTKPNTRYRYEYGTRFSRIACHVYAVGLHVKTQINNECSNETKIYRLLEHSCHIWQRLIARLCSNNNISLEYRHSTEYSQGECRKWMLWTQQGTKVSGSEYSWERKFRGHF